MTVSVPEYSVTPAFINEVETLIDVVVTVNVDAEPCEFRTVYVMVFPFVVLVMGVRPRVSIMFPLESAEK